MNNNIRCNSRLVVVVTHMMTDCPCGAKRVNRGKWDNCRQDNRRGYDVIGLADPDTTGVKNI
jgi:hypothetical protein